MVKLDGVPVVLVVIWSARTSAVAADALLTVAVVNRIHVVERLGAAFDSSIPGRGPKSVIFGS